MEISIKAFLIGVFLLIAGFTTCAFIFYTEYYEGSAPLLIIVGFFLIIFGYALMREHRSSSSNEPKYVWSFGSV